MLFYYYKYFFGSWHIEDAKNYIFMRISNPLTLQMTEYLSRKGRAFVQKSHDSFVVI